MWWKQLVSVSQRTRVRKDFGASQLPPQADIWRLTLEYLTLGATVMPICCGIEVDKHGRSIRGCALVYIVKYENNHKVLRDTMVIVLTSISESSVTAHQPGTPARVTEHVAGSPSTAREAFPVTLSSFWRAGLLNTTFSETKLHYN